MSGSRPNTPPKHGENISTLHGKTLAKSNEAKAQADESKPNSIIPNGLLANLNYGLSMMEFNKLALAPINFKDQALMGKILQADQLLKMGGSEETFRNTLSELLNLKKIDKKEFDAAWSAMLGVLDVLKTRYLSLSQQNKDKNLNLMSGTSSIHVNAIFEAVAPEDKTERTKKENPLRLESLDLYVSYLQKQLSPDECKTEMELLKEITDDEAVLKELVEYITLLKEIVTD